MDLARIGIRLPGRAPSELFGVSGKFGIREEYVAAGKAAGKISENEAMILALRSAGCVGGAGDAASSGGWTESNGELLVLFSG